MPEQRRVKIHGLGYISHIHILSEWKRLAIITDKQYSRVSSHIQWIIIYAYATTKPKQQNIAPSPFAFAQAFAFALDQFHFDIWKCKSWAECSEAKFIIFHQAIITSKCFRKTAFSTFSFHRVQRKIFEFHCKQKWKIDVYIIECDLKLDFFLLYCLILLLFYSYLSFCNFFLFFSLSFSCQ